MELIELIISILSFFFQNINEDEFREIISSLMQVTWSAAAGQLQLNTRHARPAAAAPAGGTTMTATETFTNPFMQNKKQHHVHFSHNELKAGLCLRQEFVSIMVSATMPVRNDVMFFLFQPIITSCLKFNTRYSFVYHLECLYMCNGNLCSSSLIWNIIFSSVYYPGFSAGQQQPGTFSDVFTNPSEVDRDVLQVAQCR